MKTTKDGNVLTVCLQGELDHHSAIELKDKVDMAYERSGCRHLVFNFAELTFMDSSGIGMIIGRYKNAEKRGGKVAVANMNRQLERLFDLSGLQKIVSRYDSLQAANSALEGAATNG